MASEFSIDPLRAVQLEGDLDEITEFIFTVTRSGDPTGEASVDVVFTPGTLQGGEAVEPDDFVGGLPGTQTLTFADGETEKTITYQVVGDTDVESNEAFTLTLENPVGGSVDRLSSRATATIVTDDLATQISIGTAISSLQDEGDTGTTLFVIKVLREGELSGQSTVDVVFSPNDTDASDFGGTFPPEVQTVTFEPNENVKLVTFEITGDTDIEPDEKFQISLANPTGGDLDSASEIVNLTIINDDFDEPEPQPVPVISIADTSVVEGDSGTTDLIFTVTRADGDLTQSSTVQWEAFPMGANAADGGDFLFGTEFRGELTFASGETEKTISFPVKGDTEVEEDETITVQLASPTNASLGQESAVGTILNDDVAPPPPPEPPKFSINPPVIVLLEGDAGEVTEYDFTVLRSGDPVGEASVQVSFFVDGGALANDFEELPPGTQTVIFADGESSQTVTIRVSGDDDFENDENFTLALSNPVGGVIDTSAFIAEGVIVNDDPQPLPPPTLSISGIDFLLDEGDAGTTPYIFAVRRENGDLSGSTTVDVEVVPIDTDAEDFGGTLPGIQTVTFEANETVKLVTIEVTGDTDVEANEKFQVRLVNPTNGTLSGQSSVEAQIVNDDVEAPPPEPEQIISIAPADISVEEGDAGTTEYRFTVSRSGDGTSAAAVQVAFDPGDTDAADFGDTLPDDKVTIFFEPGNLTQDIVLEVSGDLLPEADESFSLSLINPVGATLDATASSAVGTIVNDDAGPTDTGDREVILGTDQRDRLQGTNAAEVIFGFEQNDIILGRGGDDILLGGPGRDRVIGGSGEDQIFSEGDRAADIFRGGRDADTFIFSGQHGDDQIRRFEDNLDQIDLSAYASISFEDLEFLQNRSDAVISGYSTRDDSIILTNFSVLDLDEGDFIFA